MQSKHSHYKSKLQEDAQERTRLPPRRPTSNSVPLCWASRVSGGIVRAFWSLYLHTHLHSSWKHILMIKSMFLTSVTPVLLPIFFVLVSFTVVTCGRSNLREEGFILAHSFKEPGPPWLSRLGSIGSFCHNQHVRKHNCLEYDQKNIHEEQCCSCRTSDCKNYGVSIKVPGGREQNNETMQYVTGSYV